MRAEQNCHRKNSSLSHRSKYDSTWRSTFIERLERLYAHGLTDEAVNTVNSLKSELVKCTTYRRPTLPIEEKFIFLVKCYCLRVSTNLVGIIKRTKPEGVPSRCWAPLLFPSIEAHFQCDEQRFTYRRDPYYVKLRGALVKTYCGVMKARSWKK